MDTRKIAVVASVAAVALALSGCNAGNAEGPAASPTEASKSSSAPGSTSAPPSPSNTEKYEPATAKGPAQNVPVPKMPEAAKVKSKEGAAEFTRYYFDLINYTAETTKTGPIKNVTSRSCKLCAEAIIDSADESASVGEWQVGGEYKASVIDSYISAPGRAIVTARFSAEPFDTYIVPDSVVAEYSEVKSSLSTFQLSFDTKWTVEDLLVAEE
ncbi:DUF6318 family protein [Glutamicibacter sp. AGC13]